MLVQLMLTMKSLRSYVILSICITLTLVLAYAESTKSVVSLPNDTPQWIPPSSSWSSKSSAVGGCSSAGRLCCQGKNNTCRTQGPRMSNNGSFTCFCDSSCDILKDCCTDYKRTCQPVDCVLGPWQDWSECDVRCGPGIRHRTRPILTQPLNGGKSCEPTVEKTACDGTKCKYPRAPGGIEELRESGKILPALFGPWRYDKIYNPYLDIRKNLFEQYNPKGEEERPSYCAEFTIEDSRPACQSPTAGAPWTRVLSEGATVCVECQSVAMRSKLGGRCRGHGVLGRQTRWNTATAPGCTGLWTMKTPRRDCSCNPDSKLSFILI